MIIVPLVALKQLSGTNAVFVCEAEANPLHTTDWSKDGQVLTNTSKYLITGLGTAESVLTIFDLELSDTGNYTCFAENIHGNASTSDELFVQCKQMKIIEAIVHSVTSSTFIIDVMVFLFFAFPSTSEHIGVSHLSGQHRC